MAEKPTVIVDPSFRRMEEIFSPQDRERLFELVNVVWGKNEPMPHDQFMEAAEDAVAMVVAEWRNGNEVLERAKNLRAILDISGGYAKSLDFEQCFDRRIRVLSAAPSFARQVAEMALGMALSASREIALGDRAFRAGQEKYLWAGNEGTFMLYGKTVGLIGYGNLARELRRLLEPFGVKLLVHDPWLSDGYLRNLQVEPVSLERLMAESQVIFVLAIPSGENKALISRELLETIQPGAVFALMSRAHVVDFDALTELLLAGRFRAAIDVFPQEPLAVDHPIRKAEAAVLSAHRAGAVKEGLWEIGEMVLDDLEAILRGLPPLRMQVAQPELIARINPQPQK